MTVGQKPARVPDDEDHGGNIGKSREDVIHGSRLSKEMGDGAPKGHPEVEDDGTVTASRIARMMQGKRVLRKFTWPGADWECGVCVLTEEEIEEAGIWASERLTVARAKMDAINFQERFAQECSIQLLWRCLIDPVTYRPVAKTPDELRKHLTTDMAAYLVDIYNEWQHQISPLSSPETSERETLEVLDALKKDPEDLLLGVYGAGALRHLLRSLARQTANLPSSKS